MIPYGRQSIVEQDIAAVSKILKSDWITQGPTVPKFEALFAERTHAKYAVAMNSATSALHVACLALELGPGDWLWTVPNTFVASANCGKLCGAFVDFVDIEPKSYCMDPEALETKLKAAARAGKLPKVIIPVHYAGQSANMDAISNLAKQYDVKIIEDASHAVGASYLKAPVGSCQFGDIAVFSFHPVKIMTTAEGGIATTNDLALRSKMQRIRTHGVTRIAEDMVNPNSDPWVYEQLELGLNYRMTDIHAALGISQLSRLEDFLTRRRQIAAQYDELLAELPLVLPWQNPQGKSALHLYPILLDTKNSVTDRLKLFKKLRSSGIGVNVHYIPVHTQPYYRQFGFRSNDFPVSKWFYDREISLPIYFTLTDQQQKYVVDCIHSEI